MAANATFEITPIGEVRREANSTYIAIDEAYREGLKGLDGFSHVIVYWWAQRFDEPQYRAVLVTPLPYAEGRESGVFANRAPLRPNLIMSSVCPIIGVDEETGQVRIADIDAFDETPVIDLKPYFPVTDRVQNAHIPDFLVGWPEWMPEEGIGLMEYEIEG